MTAAALAIAGGVLASPAYADGGDLDRAFGADGVVAHGAGSAREMVIAPDGRIITAGSGLVGRSLAFELHRYRPDGRADASFSHDGKATTLFARSAACGGASAVARQADGKIVAVGRSGCVGGRFAVARYLPDGRLDRSFSGDGKLTTRFGLHCRFSQADGVAIQRDGRIVAAGRAGCTKAGNFVVAFALARYTPDGRLDRTFGRNGRATTDFTAQWDVASDVVVEPAGTIVAAGTAALESTVEGRAVSQIAVARYARDGTLDRSFGERGRVMTALTNVAGCESWDSGSLARQRDGRIVVAGSTGCAGHPRFALARYTAGGILDSTFGATGIVTTAFVERDACSEVLSDLAIQPDSRIVAAGVAGCQDPHPSFALARYMPDGQLDDSFGGDGKVTTTLCTAPDPGTGLDENHEQINAIGLYRDRIVAVGFNCLGVALLRYQGR